ncbi:MAG: S8 family peptidase [Bacteroidia bacterium]|nr:S8 family peptidase [Bacteroidia bacterium]
MRIFFFCLIFFFFNLEIFGQTSMNLALYNRLEFAGSDSEKLSVMVKGDPDRISSKVQELGGTIQGISGRILAIRLSVIGLSELIHSGLVSRMEAYPHNYRVLNDTMRMLCRVNEVQHGQPPLTDSLDGTGVVIGYIDSGIDLHHPDFQDSLGHTRVKWLWDMNKPVAANTPVPYGYGQEWNASQIDSGLAVSHTGEDQYGHGTYVSGIGSGNGNAVGHFQGVAPGSDIIAVSFDFASQDTVPRLAHAVDYIFSKADQLGKPCVINASLGDYIGTHDGTDLESQYISNRINAHNGRVLVAAAGNIGVVYPFHVQRVSSPGDTAFTWFVYNPAYGGLYTMVTGDSATFSGLKFSLGADQVTPNYSFRGATPFVTVSSTLNNVVTRNVFNGPNRIGVVQTLATSNAGVYTLEVFIVPDSTGYYWRFSSTGSGRFDSWNFDYQFQNLPSATVFPPIQQYLMPDTNQTIVTGIACLDNVITVGNYYNTDRHIDVNGILQITPTDRPRDLAENSSRGPTRDGRIKPDICAPGHHIISCGVLTLIPGMIASQPYKVAQGGYHVTGGGTSASAPVVAGIAALYLEQNPNAGWSDVKNALLNCSYHDTYTWGPFPNNAWGAGKVDAFGAVTTCAPLTSIHTPDPADQIILFPNPARDVARIRLPDEFQGLALRLDLYSSDGRHLMEKNLPVNETLFTTGTLSSGFYFLQVTGENVGRTLKLVIE